MRNNTPHPLAHRHPHSIPNPHWQRHPLDPSAHFPLPTVLCSALASLPIPWSTRSQTPTGNGVHSIPLLTSLCPPLRSALASLPIPWSTRSQTPRWQRRPLDPSAHSPRPTVLCSAPLRTRSAHAPHTLRTRSAHAPLPTPLRALPPQTLRKRDARRLREDFCGTFLHCCEWVSFHEGNTAVGIDNDTAVLAWGREEFGSPYAMLDEKDQVRRKRRRGTRRERERERRSGACAERSGAKR